MRPSSRLFETIQLLRAASRPLTAAELAAALEVSVRTVYRDIAALQAMRTPIEGAAGLGYMIRRSYDLPPLNFDEEEAEALTLGLALLVRTGDPALQKAARRISAKIEALRSRAEALRVTPWAVPVSQAADPAELRGAIREERKLHLRYLALDGARSERVVLPLALVYGVEVVLLAAWCELRQDFRHFRIDRIEVCTTLDQRFAGQGPVLRARWEAGQAAEAG